MLCDFAAAEHGKLPRGGHRTAPYLGSAFVDQLIRCHDANRAIGDEVAPHPMVMPDHGGSIQVRPIAHCVTIANINDVIVV